MYFPLSTFEAWPTPNYVDPVERGSANTIFQLVLYPIVFCAVTLRVYTRLRLSKCFGADDILIICALVCTTAVMALSLLMQLRWHLARHVWDLELKQMIIGLKAEVASNAIFDMACALTKLSMLVMTRKIILPSDGFMQKTVKVTMVLVALQSVIFLIVVSFQCRPISDYWKITFKPQTNCISQPANILTAGIINTMTDFLVVALPIPIVYSLKLHPRQKCIVILLFGIGFSVCIAGVARTVYTYNFVSSIDQSWNAFPVWITSCSELYLGIICTSIPPTRVFFKHYMPRLFGTNFASGTMNQELKSARISGPLEKSPRSQSTRSIHTSSSDP